MKPLYLIFDKITNKMYEKRRKIHKKSEKYVNDIGGKIVATISFF